MIKCHEEAFFFRHRTDKIGYKFCIKEYKMLIIKIRYLYILVCRVSGSLPAKKKYLLQKRRQTEKVVLLS